MFRFFFNSIRTPKLLAVLLLLALGLALPFSAEAGKKKKVALVACMRKLLTILNAILRDRKPWQFPATQT